MPTFDTLRFLLVYEVVTYRINSAKTKSGMKNVGQKVVARFDDLAAAHEFAEGKIRHFVQYTKNAMEKYNA